MLSQTVVDFQSAWKRPSDQSSQIARASGEGARSPTKAAKA